MQYEVEFEMGDGDKDKETGIMIDTVCIRSRVYALVVLGNQSLTTVPLVEIRIVDEAIGQKFLAIEAKHQKLDLPLDIVNN